MVLVAGVLIIGLASLLEPYLGAFDEKAALLTYGAIVFLAFCVSFIRRLFGE